MKLRYRNLTAVQRDKICNGCGGKGGWLDPPDYLFAASCDHHDFQYWLGGEELHRKKADRQFYEAMLIDVSRAPWYSRWWLRGAAWRYYVAVRMCGKKYFHYGRQRTWDDVP